MRNEVRLGMWEYWNPLLTGETGGGSLPKKSSGCTFPLLKARWFFTPRFHSWQRERHRNRQGYRGALPGFLRLFSRYLCSSSTHALHLAFSHKIVTQGLTHIATNPCHRICNPCILVSMTQIHCNALNHCPLVRCFGCFYCFFPLAGKKNIVMNSYCLKSFLYLDLFSSKRF